MTDHDRNERLRRTTGESVYVRYVVRRDDDPEVQRQLRPRASRPKPLRWSRWLLIGIVTAGVAGGTLAFVVTGDDDQALGRVLLAALGAAVVGWLAVVALARLGAFRRTDGL